MHRVWHLIRRFFGALRPGAPSSADDAWVRGVLTPDEYALWSRLPNHDRRHSAGVARDVERKLAGTEFAGDPRWSEAAVLHDVGKLESGLGVFGRVGATLIGAAVGRARAAAWEQRRGVRGRVGKYVDHPALGAAAIRAAGGSEPAARWAAAHHERSAWAATDIPAPVVEALHAADDD